MERVEHVQLIAAIMRAAGVEKVFVPAEALVGFGPHGYTLTWFEDFPRDGYVFVLVKDEEIVEAEVVEAGKEIEA